MQTLTKIGGGMAGFDFTKLGASGTESAGTKWSCVRDNTTGLVWEIKTDNGSKDSDTTDNNHTNIHHKDNAYHWGGKTALGKTHANKQGTYYDDWTGLVDGSNFCGFTDWKVPNKVQLRSIVHYGRNNPAIDTDYFPNSNTGKFWSSLPSALDSSRAWLQLPQQSKRACSFGAFRSMI